MRTILEGSKDEDLKHELLDPSDFSYQVIKHSEKCSGDAVDSICHVAAMESVIRKCACLRTYTLQTV